MIGPCYRSIPEKADGLIPKVPVPPATPLATAMDTDVPPVSIASIHRLAAKIFDISKRSQIALYHFRPRLGLLLIDLFLFRVRCRRRKVGRLKFGVESEPRHLRCLGPST